MPLGGNFEESAPLFQTPHMICSISLFLFKTAMFSNAEKRRGSATCKEPEPGLEFQNLLQQSSRIGSKFKFNSSKIQAEAQARNLNFTGCKLEPIIKFLYIKIAFDKGTKNLISENFLQKNFAKDIFQDFLELSSL